KTYVQYALVMLSFYFLPEILKDVKAYDKARKDYLAFYSTQQQAIQFFNTIKDYKTEKDIVTVQLPQNLGFNYLYMLPLKSNEGKPIRYNLTEFKAPPEKSEFITHYLKLPD